MCSAEQGSSPEATSALCLDHAGVKAWLREQDPAALAFLWSEADRVRKSRVGDDVHLRGLIEVSSHCIRHCLYCGLRAPSKELDRYRMAEAEILACAQEAFRLGYGSVVLQAGEDPSLTRDFIAGIVRAIKRDTPLAVTLSLGDHRSLDEVVRDLAEMGFIPSFCTSCYRMGRTGVDFMDIAKPGEIKAHCNPNALSTLQEYLEDHASPLTRCSAEQLMARSFTDLGDPARKIAEGMVARVKRGERDVFC